MSQPTITGVEWDRIDKFLFSERNHLFLRWFLHLILAILAPVLAACLHSYSVMQRGYRFYNAELWLLIDGGDRFADWRKEMLISMAIKMGFSFLVLWIGIKTPAKRWLLWCLCIAVWMLLARFGEVTIR